MAEMHKKQSHSARLYWLKIVRFDGSSSTVLWKMPINEAQQAHEAIIDAGLFADIHIVPETEG